jgi:hypothetical protein
VPGLPGQTWLLKAFSFPPHIPGSWFALMKMAMQPFPLGQMLVAAVLPGTYTLVKDRVSFLPSKKPIRNLRVILP